MRFENINIEGLNIFYREAGDETAPKPGFCTVSGFVSQYRAHRSPAYKACSGPN